MSALVSYVSAPAVGLVIIFAPASVLFGLLASKYSADVGVVSIFACGCVLVTNVVKVRLRLVPLEAIAFSDLGGKFACLKAST